MSAVEYFEKWFQADKRGILPLSPREAEARHAEGRHYVAVLTNDANTRVIDIGDDWVSVLFLDEDDRIYLRYDFQRVESGDLFLSRTMYLEYRNGDDSPCMSETSVFSRDGSMLIEKTNIETGDVYEKDSSSSDLAENSEAYPAFGDYTSVSRLDRHA